MRSSSPLALGLALAPAAFALAVGALGCNSGPDPKMVAAKNDGVPANSASEERLKAGDKAEKKDEARGADPSQPYTQPVGGEATPGGPKEVGAPAGKEKPGKDGKEKPAPAGKGSKDKVPKAECTKALDRFLDLTIASDSRFEGIPPEVLSQMKQQGFSQVAGPNPCDGGGITRAQYDCAMTASSTSAWQRCMK